MVGANFNETYRNQRLWSPRCPLKEEHYQIMGPYFTRLEKRNPDQKKRSCILFILWFFAKFGSKSIDNAISNIRYY